MSQLQHFPENISTSLYELDIEKPCWLLESNINLKPK